MVREAQKAGLEFDEEKLEALHCCHEDAARLEARRQTLVPTIEIDPGSPPPIETPDPSGLGQHTNGTNGPSSATTNGWIDDENFASHHREHPDTPFHKHLHYAATKGRIHDVLQFNNGVPRMSVASWNMMEYLPFRRMDLQEDGTWKAIIWPLPKGETRDIPANATIHCSVIQRMLADPTYRPGNLIVGGGGRGVRHAPKDMGIGKWVIASEEGHYVGECLVRKEPPERTKTDETVCSPAMPGGPQGNFFAGRKSSRAA
ncbi:hypothetical protein BKA66DRAFT_252734 [Pyrenochaeta sp. MPI-SDFR-AT-0127]|nr:hypothetical protein BKA66DRAFT_252734 [Pyrenochaeta sp. MPI-SDFR-AT-0127]